jgi:adenosylmethionine-8-amino-7-oxononanoate aminotransferase
LSEETLQLAEKIIEVSPFNRGKVFFCNSGSEANDSAVKMLWMLNRKKGKPYKRKIITRINAYHGVTLGSGSMTGKPYIEEFGLPLADFIHADCPHYWKFCLPNETEDNFSKRMAKNLENLILKEGAETIAGFFAEPIMGAGGVIPPSEGYFDLIQPLLKKYNIPFIADEVITGFRYALGGAQELFNITPDFSCFGKGLGNGMPISAVVGKKEIMNEMEEVFFSGTFGGETLSLAAAIAVIDKMKKDQVIQSLWEKGSYLSKEVTSLIGKYNLSDVIRLSGKAPWKLLNFYNYGNAEGELIKTFYMVEMLKHGVLTSGSHNICYALNKVDLEHILNAYEKTFITLSNLIKTGKLNNSLPCPIIRPVFNVRQAV